MPHFFEKVGKCFVTYTQSILLLHSYLGLSCSIHAPSKGLTSGAQEFEQTVKYDLNRPSGLG